MAGGKTDHALERLVFFSDAVFAIAITLLIIEIHPPHLPHHSADAAHWQALAQLIPSFVGYFVSFMVIGLFWMGHHRAFSLAAHYSPRVLWWNLMMLMVIAFMPFTTGYFSSNLNEPVPTYFYCGGMLMAALLNLKVNWTATSPPMVDETAPKDEIVLVRRRSISVLLGAATAFGLALIEPQAGPIGLVSIGIWRRVLMRFGGRPATMI
jgi:uncharacterized membrane protein